MEYAFEASDQTVIEGSMTELQEPVVYDKVSGDTPRDIEANWLATISAKSLLQKVREFRASTQASYGDDSKKSVRETLEDAELELESLGKESFNTRKILQGVQKLKAALKAAEEVIVQGPDPKTMTSKAAYGEKSATQMDEGLQETEKDNKSEEEFGLLENIQRAELDAVIAESQSRGRPDRL